MDLRLEDTVEVKTSINWYSNSFYNCSSVIEIRNSRIKAESERNLKIQGQENNGSGLDTRNKFLSYPASEPEKFVP